MSEDAVDGIGLADAINQIKAGLAEAQNKPAAPGIWLPVKSVTVELRVVATKEGNARAGFKVPLFEIGGGGSLSQERTHTITVVFDAPVDENHNPLMVGKTSGQHGT